MNPLILSSNISLGLSIAEPLLVRNYRCSNCKQIVSDLDKMEEHLNLDQSPELDLKYICVNKNEKLIEWLQEG